MLTKEQIDTYNERGFLRVPQVFDATEIQELSDEMDRLMEEWANLSPGWAGDWRKQYMDSKTEKRSKLLAMHELQNYSNAWLRAVTHPTLVSATTDVLGPDVEFHHSTMHVKPPQAGHPFPMHQDNPFYVHTDSRYLDVLVHLDDTSHENGEIRFLEGSHQLGYLEHIVEDQAGNACTPHLPTDKYKLEDTVAVPAKKGDIVFFNILTIHGSYINQTEAARRMVRVGYRHPHNTQLSGQNFNQQGFIVAGKRHKVVGEATAEYEVLAQK